MLLLGGAMTTARALRAQQKAMPVIGYLESGAPGASAPLVAAFHQGLSETGYVEGQNLGIEYRWAEHPYDRLPALAADLVGRKVDLIVAAGGVLSALAAKGATSTIPIVFTAVIDPVDLGLVAITRALVERRAKPVEAVPASSTLGGDLGKTTTPPASVSL